MSNNNNRFSPRMLMLSEDVDSVSMKEMVTNIIACNMYDDYMEQTVQNYNRVPIVLIVNSFGGSVYDGMALISAIEMSATPIYTLCLGSAMSMGLNIFASGHVRMIHELSTLMYHEVARFGGGKLTQIVEDVTEMERLQLQYDYYLINKSKVQEHMLREVKDKKKDWFIDANEAVKLGIADTIIPVGEQVSWSFNEQE